MTRDLDSLSDERLITDYQQTGNQAIFEIVHKRRVNLVQGFLHNIMPTALKSQVPDLVQEVFIQLHIRDDVDFQHGYKVATWLLQVAEDRAGMLIRRMNRGKRNNGKAEVEIGGNDKAARENPIEEASQHEIAERVHAMVRCLPEPEREAVALTLKGLSRRDAAEKLGITPGIFKGRLDRGLLALRGMTSTRMKATVA